MLAALPASATPMFQGLGVLGSGFTSLSLAEAVSADGRVVAGRVSGGGFRWTAETGIQSLGVFFPQGVSGDGSVIVGNLANRAARWTESTGAVQLPSASPGSRLMGISGGGSIAAGFGGASGPFLWTEAGGYELIPGGSIGDISQDGHVVVGSVSQDPGAGPPAARWTEGTGWARFPARTPVFGSIANAASADGSVIVEDRRTISLGAT
jgi:uncharacterized membrane protein